MIINFLILLPLSLNSMGRKNRFGYGLVKNIKAMLSGNYKLRLGGCLRDRTMLSVISKEEFSLHSVFMEMKKVALENV